MSTGLNETTRRDLRLSAFLIAAAALFWYNAQSIYFIGDDFTLITEQMLSPFSLFTISAQFIMPTFKFFLAFLGEIFGYNPVVFHRAILIIHVLNTLMFFHIVKRFTGSQYISFFSALLWATLPQYAGSIYWITGSVHTVTLLFVLAAVLMFFRWEDTKKHVFLALSLLLLIIGFYCKETATVGLFFLFGYLLAKKRNLKQIVRTLAPYISLYAVMIILNFVIRSGADKSMSGYYTLNPLKIFQLVIYYTLYNIFGVQWIPSKVLTLLIIAVLATAVYLVRKSDLFPYVVMYFLTLLPFVVVGKTPQRYSYMTAMWLIPLLVLAVSKFYSMFRDSVIRFAAIALAIFFILVSVIRVRIEYMDYEYFSNLHRETVIHTADFLARDAEDVEVYLYAPDNKRRTLLAVNRKIRGFKKLLAMRGRGVGELIYLDDLYNFIIRSGGDRFKEIRKQGIYFEQMDRAGAFKAVMNNSYTLISYSRKHGMNSWKFNPEGIRQIKEAKKIPGGLIPYKLCKKELKTESNK